MVFTCCQSNVWNGIVPLKSTRTDVEKLLGSPEEWNRNPHSNSFKINDGQVFVRYSTGPCDRKPSNGWNIPANTVIAVSVFTNVGPKLVDLKIDEKQFERWDNPHIGHEASYTNLTDGIQFTVDKYDNQVTSFSYFPESKFNYLKCKDVKKKRDS